MKKIAITVLGALTLLAGLNAQATSAPAPTAQSEVGTPQPEYVGVDKAQQELKEISISRFEDDGFWLGSMPRDDGFISLRRFEGSPIDKKPIEDEVAAGIKEDDKYVLGGKIEHLKRAVTYFKVLPIRPLAIPGITKTISLWVVGRNVKHQLYVIINDQFGNRAKVPLGDMAFSGWKKLTAAVPPNIRQADPRYNNKQGIMITEFLIETDPAETYGSYYFYMDDLRVVTDLFAEKNRDADDMVDFW